MPFGSLVLGCWLRLLRRDVLIEIRRDVQQVTIQIRLFETTHPTLIVHGTTNKNSVSLGRGRVRPCLH